MKILLTITLVMAVVSTIALVKNWLLRADYLLFDSQVKLHAATQVADKDIVIIAIDDYSLAAMQAVAGRWVWSRSVHAELIEGLQQYSPKLIAFDVLFAEADVYRPDDDAYFNEVIAENDNVYFSMLVLDAEGEQGELLSNYSTLPFVKDERNGVNNSARQGARGFVLLPKAINEQHWRLGTINYQAEVDGIGRYYDVYYQNDLFNPNDSKRAANNWQLYSLASTLALASNIKLPTQQRILLNWQSNSYQPYQTYSYADIYQAVITNNINVLSKLTGKTIVIGTTAAGLYDARVTPISHNLPGVYMLATALDNLQQQAYFTVVDNKVRLVFTFVLLALVSCCFYFATRYSKQLLSVSLLVLTSVIGAFFISLELMQSNMVILVAAPIILMATSAGIHAFIFGYLEFVNKNRALTMFGRFLDPKVVMNLLADGKLSATQLNKKTQVSVLFSDIRGFTSLSEQHSTQQVLTLLNQYFSQQVKVIFHTQGTLDKFIGDCLMAFWGAPVTSEKHAEQAIEAALTMQENLHKFKQSLPPSLQDFDIGIGIHSGEVIAGLVGTEQRVDYTVIGDAVNLASRIEGLTKDKCRVLVSEQTMLQAENSFKFIYQGEFAVKGRVASVKVYQPQRLKIGE